MAKRLGYGDALPESQEELTRFQLEKATDKALAGITLDEVVSHNGVVALKNQPDIARSYGNQTYKTTSGKIDLYYENLVEYGQALPQYEAPHEAFEGNPLRNTYPLVMTQRRSKYFIHQNLMDDRGSFQCACIATEAVRPGTTVIVEGIWSKYMTAGDLQNVTNDAANPRGKALAKGRVTPFNDTLVEVKKA